jgi:hypothetical protein
MFVCSWSHFTPVTGEGNADSIGVTKGGSFFESADYALPRVFLAKSAQPIEKKWDTRNCDLKRVRKRLKTKDRVFAQERDRWG